MFFLYLNIFSSYGIQGQAVITSRLRQLFPEASFEKDIYHPLTWNAFVNDFLLPETLLLLIQEDKHISRDDALRILQETRFLASAKTVCSPQIFIFVPNCTD